MGCWFSSNNKSDERSFFINTDELSNDSNEVEPENGDLLSSKILETKTDFIYHEFDNSILLY